MKNKLIISILAVIMTVTVFAVPAVASAAAESGWSQWTTEEPDDGAQYKEAVFYRYRVKDIKKLSAGEAVPAGYKKDEKASTDTETICYKYSRWSQWIIETDWNEEAVRSTLKEGQELKTESVTKYSVFEGLEPQTIYVRDTFTAVYGDKPFSLKASAKTTLQYGSSDTSIAAVSSDGMVEVKGAGKAYITISALEENGYEAASKVVQVDVSKAEGKISCSTVKYDITYGEDKGKTPFSLKASSKAPLSYKSSNKNIATVSSAGKVTVKNPGKAVITISSAGDSNCTKAKAVSVSLNISLKKPVISLKATGKKIARITPVTKTPGAEGYETWILNPGKSKYTKLGTASSEKKYFRFIGTKGKTYKVKVRGCRKVSGKYVYSSFSSVKSVKIK